MPEALSLPCPWPLLQRRVGRRWPRGQEPRWLPAQPGPPGHWSVLGLRAPRRLTLLRTRARVRALDPRFAERKPRTKHLISWSTSLLNIGHLSWCPGTVVNTAGSSGVQAGACLPPRPLPVDEPGWSAGSHQASEFWGSLNAVRMPPDTSVPRRPLLSSALPEPQIDKPTSPAIPAPLPEVDKRGGPNSRQCPSRADYTRPMGI